MKAYATRTGTKRNLKALRDAGWGLLVTPDAARTEGFTEYGIDNGAWSAHTKGLDWDSTYRAKFERLVEDYGAAADFIVAPDIVAAGAASLARSVEWLPGGHGGVVRRRQHRVQDRQPADVVVGGAGVGLLPARCSSQQRAAHPLLPSLWGGQHRRHERQPVRGGVAEAGRGAAPADAEVLGDGVSDMSDAGEDLAYLAAKLARLEVDLAEARAALRDNPIEVGKPMYAIDAMEWLDKHAAAISAAREDIVR